ncbi:hypothetical protein V3331_11890 [Gaopeijia maritima]|uniref:hypothetical protein n=1 Tax=Gaopeijia maritima TaxID=3119007 RepID=UPI00324370AC
MIRRTVASVAFLALAAVAPAAAQLAPPLQVEAPEWAERVHVETRPAAPVVGVSVAWPVGSGADAEGRTGVGQAAADAVVASVEASLGAGQAEGRARVEPDRTLLTFLVRPERVEALLDALERATRSPLDGAPIDDALRRRTEVLRFEFESPVNEVDAQRRAMLYGDDDPRVRAPGGTLEDFESRITRADVESAHRAIFTGGAHLVLVGAVAFEGASPRVESTAVPAAPDSLATDAPGGAAPAAPVVPERPVAGTTSAGPAWTTGDRRVVHRPVTNSWIAVAWPVPADLSRVAVLYLADRMHRELNAVPPDPGIFNATAEVAELPDGEIILVRAAVLPEATDRFEARILGLPAELARERDAAFFRFHRGRFRASRLIDEAAPEAAADRMALELLTRGAVLDFDEAVWELDVDEAADAATSLGEPRVLVFGPDLGGG